MKKQVIAYTHFHWDREWYKEFETFRYRLIKSFDIVLEMLQQNKLPSFYFDGQTSALLDYLEICPEKEDLIKDLVKNKRLYIGPFYCLVDEFLTSKDVFKKNLELGLDTAIKFGCKDFVAYFADTFGHSSCTIPILKEFGIDKAVVWRGCGDIPAEFTWKYNSDSISTINLIRGYFNDIFSTNLDIEKKCEFLKKNLDLISEKSGETLLLPIGADHLGVPTDLQEQIDLVNKNLDDYEIKLGSIFKYFDIVKNRFGQYEHIGELRDNSKTFILEGCYSSRLDIKRWNVTASHRLKVAKELVKSAYITDKKSLVSLIDYAYKLLLQNQAHDSICGCSTDDVHRENLIRYKKILQIADSIIRDFKLQNSFDGTKVLNLGPSQYTGSLTFDSDKTLSHQIIDCQKGFPSVIFDDIYKIPITEDYTDIYTYTVNCKNQPEGLTELSLNNESDVFITESCLGNSKIFANVKNNNLYIGDKLVEFIDYIDLGDSYNYGPKEDDNGVKAILKSTDIEKKGDTCSILKLCYELKGELITVYLSLNSYDDKFKFDINWKNTHKNHLLQICFNTGKPIYQTLSEDLDEIVVRKFNPDYDVRKHLPKEKGKEVMFNNAPMQRGVMANSITVVTQGITQFEIVNTELRLPLLRATGVISNKFNTARTTPAGPPIEVDDLQLLGINKQTIWVGIEKDLKTMISEIYNLCII